MAVDVYGESALAQIQSTALSLSDQISVICLRIFCDRSFFSAVLRIGAECPWSSEFTGYHSNILWWVGLMLLKLI